MEGVPQGHDLPVQVPQPLLVRHPAVAGQEGVVGDGLDLQKVVHLGHLGQRFLRFPLEHALEQLPRLAGGTHDKPLAV